MYLVLETQSALMLSVVLLTIISILLSYYVYRNYIINKECVELIRENNLLSKDTQADVINSMNECNEFCSKMNQELERMVAYIELNMKDHKAIIQNQISESVQKINEVSTNLIKRELERNKKPQKITKKK